MASDDALLHCAGELRRQDPDRHLITTLVPPPGRRAVVALFAFNLELARIREQVSEPMLGEMRLQFWRDTLNELVAGKVRAHPVAQALGAALPGQSLPLNPLLSLIDARARDLDDAPPADMSELVSYAQHTAGALNVLALRVLGVTDREVATAARAAGAGAAMVGLMRALPALAAQRRLFVPAEVLMRLKVDREATFAGRHTPELGKAIGEVVAEAEIHLNAARKIPLPRVARPIFGSVLLAVRDAQALRTARGNPFAMKPRGPLSRQLTLALSVLTGRV